MAVSRTRPVAHSFTCSTGQRRARNRARQARDERDLPHRGIGPVMLVRRPGLYGAARRYWLASCRSAEGAAAARHARGEVLRVEPASPTVHSGAHGDTPAVDVTATRDPGTGQLTIFAVNRHEHDPIHLCLRLATTETLEVAEHLVLGGENLLATNSKDTPNRSRPGPAPGTRLTVRKPGRGLEP
jgi:hypothetical protein